VGKTFDAVWEALGLYWFIQQRQKATTELTPNYSIVFTLRALLEILYWEKPIPGDAYAKLKTALRTLRGMSYFETKQHFILKGPNKGKPSWESIDWGNFITRLQEGYEDNRVMYAATLNEKYCLPLEAFNIKTPQAALWKFTPQQEFKRRFPGLLYSYSEREDPSRVLKLNKHERQLHNVRHRYYSVSKTPWGMRIDTFLRDRMLLRETTIDRLVKRYALKGWITELMRGYGEKMEIKTKAEFELNYHGPELRQQVRLTFEESY